MKIPKIERLPSGNYRCRLRLDGKSISITAETPGLCEARAIAVKSGIITGDAVRYEDLTLREACTKYIKAKSPQLSVTSIQSYEKIRDNNFQELMDKKITALNNKTLQRAVDAECAKTSRRGRRYAPKTVVNNYMFLVSVIHYINDKIDTTVKLPEIKEKPIFILTPEEVFDAVSGTEIELPVLLSMWLSFSMSEIRGLTKSKSIRDGKITTVETVVDVHGEAVRKEDSKEERRARSLAIPPYIMKLIDNVDGDVIVPMTANALSKRFTRALEKAGLPHMSFHKLRHINASVMADLNIPDHIANSRGGWKTNYTRQRVYTHTFPESRKAADTKIDDAFNRIISSYLPANRPRETS